MVFKKIKNVLVEEFKCVICKNIFLRVVKQRGRSLPNGVRRFNAKTCKRECAKDYSRLNKNQRDGLKNYN